MLIGDEGPEVAITLVCVTMNALGKIVNCERKTEAVTVASTPTKWYDQLTKSNGLRRSNPTLEFGGCTWSE